MMLLKKLNLVSLKAGRLLDILTVVHKSPLGIMPACVSSLLQLRNNINNLRSINKLQMPRVNTTSYGQHSTRFLAAKLWNELDDKLRASTNTTYFKNNVDLASLLTTSILVLLFSYFIIVIIIVSRRILFLLFECIYIVIISFNL